MANSSTSVRQYASNLFKNTHVWLAHQLDDQKPKGTIAVLDGVRAMACIIVVVYHSTGVVFWSWGIDNMPFWATWNNAGAQGVTLFFVLSGFLLFSPYVQALLFEKSWPQARIFYLRRILRIIPGYYFALFALILLAKPSYLQPHNWKTTFFFLAFLMTHEQSNQLNGVYWTLAVEFQYYMLLPLIALGIYGLTRLVRPKQRLWVVIGSLFAMIIWGLGTHRWGDDLFARPDAQTYLASHPIVKDIAFVIYGLGDQNHGKYFEDFAIGMLLVVCYTVAANSPRKATYQRILLRLSPWAWWTGVALLVFATWRNTPNPAWLAPVSFFNAYPGWAVEFAFAVGFGCCIQAILFSGPGILKRFFGWTPLRWLGLISFSLYLWHEPIIASLEGNLAPTLFAHLSPWLALCLFAIVECMLVLPISFTLYALVERPGMNLSERLRKKLMQRRQEKPVHTINTPTQDEKFDPEKTEPRQPVVLAETPHH